MQRSRDLPDHLSASQITTYLSCPRKYRFKYVDHEPPESRSIDLAFGSAVHASFAWWVGERIAERDPPESSLLRTFRADWTAEEALGPLVARHRLQRSPESTGVCSREPATRRADADRMWGSGLMGFDGHVEAALLHLPAVVRTRPSGR